MPAVADLDKRKKEKLTEGAGHIIFLGRENQPAKDAKLWEIAVELARNLVAEVVPLTAMRVRAKPEAPTGLDARPSAEAIYSGDSILHSGLFKFVADVIVSSCQASFAVSTRARLHGFVAHGRVLGVEVGDIIFDNAIRNDLAFLNPRRAVWNVLLCLVKSRLSVRWLNNFSSNKNVRGLCVTSLAPLEAAVLARASALSSVPVFVGGGKLLRRFDSAEDLRKGFYFVSQEEVESVRLISGWETIVDEYMAERFSPVKHPLPAGFNGGHDVEKAFRDKSVMGLEAFHSEFISSSKSIKPVVVLSLHCFSDFPHNAGDLLFLDFYSAFTETLEMVSLNRNVSWIVKPHPSRDEYGEGDLVEDYLQSKGYSNVSLWPNQVSMLSALNWATGFVTVNGTIGVEAACFAKPVLLGGSSNYGHLGFNIVPKTKDEYRDQIMEAHNWKALDENRAKMARQTLFRYHNLGPVLAASKPVDHAALTEMALGRLNRLWSNK